MLYALSTRHKGEDTYDLPKEVLVFSSAAKRRAYYESYSGPGYAAISVARKTIEEIEEWYRGQHAKLVWRAPQRRSTAWMEEGIRRRATAQRVH